MSLAALLHDERARRPGCVRLQGLVDRVEEALADPAPLGVGEELRELLRVEVAAERELEGMLDRLRGCLGPLLALELDLLEELWPPEEGRTPLTLAVARADVARLEAKLQDRRSEAGLRWRLAEAADEEDLVESNRKAGTYEAEARVWAARDAWGALAEGPEPAAEDGTALEAQLVGLEKEQARAERALSEAEERADALLDEMIEEDLDAIDETLMLATLRGGCAEERANLVWWHLEERGLFSPAWEEWANAADAVSSAECCLEDVQTQLGRLEEGEPVGVAWPWYG